MAIVVFQHQEQFMTKKCRTYYGHILNHHGIIIENQEQLLPFDDTTYHKNHTIISGKQSIAQVLHGTLLGFYNGNNTDENTKKMSP